MRYLTSLLIEQKYCRSHFFHANLWHHVIAFQRATSISLKSPDLPPFMKCMGKLMHSENEDHFYSKPHLQGIFQSKVHQGIQHKGPAPESTGSCSGFVYIRPVCLGHINMFVHFTPKGHSQCTPPKGHSPCTPPKGHPHNAHHPKVIHHAHLPTCTHAHSNPCVCHIVHSG